jgi:hypothetical protein
LNDKCGWLNGSGRKNCIIQEESIVVHLYERLVVGVNTMNILNRKRQSKGLHQKLVAMILVHVVVARKIKSVARGHNE